MLFRSLNVIGVDASAKFFKELAGVTDPEKKRKIIGKGFIDVFDEEAHKLTDVKWLGQGTIYPDCIESLSITGTTIKSHHNVGGLPEKMNLRLCEPLRLLFKDEVRAVGRQLGMPEYGGRLQREPEKAGSGVEGLPTGSGAEEDGLSHKGAHTFEERAVSGGEIF